MYALYKYTFHDAEQIESTGENILESLCEYPQRPTELPSQYSQLGKDYCNLCYDGPPLDEDARPEERKSYSSDERIWNPHQPAVGGRRHSCAGLQQGDHHRHHGKSKEAHPMTRGPLRKTLNRISFRLASELITVQGDNEEILHVVPDCLSVIPPKGCDSV